MSRTTAIGGAAVLAAAAAVVTAAAHTGSVPVRLAGTWARTVRGSVVFGPTADGFCPDPASYCWTVSGRTLRLTLERDDCTARSILLTAGTWTRQ
jgi:hypothetical protein